MVPQISGELTFRLRDSLVQVNYCTFLEIISSLCLVYVTLLETHSAIYQKIPRKQLKETV